MNMAINANEGTDMEITTYTRYGRTYRRTDEGDVIGPKMHYAIRRVGREGAVQSRRPLAISVGPHGSTNYGYQIVNRCSRAGMITIDADHPDANPHGSGAVVLTEKGRRYLDAVEAGR